MGQENNNNNQAVDLTLLKKEVDALQVAFIGQKTPWYKSASTIISVVALLFSFGTTFVSYKRTQEQDIQNNRIELRQLLQRLASLPRENVENTKKYEKTDPTTMALIGGYINQENTILARQATEITNKIQSKFISSTEYYAIGLALQNAYDVDGARRMYTKAINISNNMNDRVGALRMRANILFIMGLPNEGRIDFQRALNVFSEFKTTTYNEFTIKSTHIYTELNWAYAEANIGAKEFAQQHLIDAEKIITGMPISQGSGQLSNLINQAKNTIKNANSRIIPPSSGF